MVKNIVFDQIQSVQLSQLCSHMEHQLLQKTDKQEDLITTCVNHESSISISQDKDENSTLEINLNKSGITSGLCKIQCVLLSIPEVIAEKRKLLSWLMLNT